MRMRSNLEKTILIEKYGMWEEMEGNLTKYPYFKDLDEAGDTGIMASSFLGTLYNLRIWHGSVCLVRRQLPELVSEECTPGCHKGWHLWLEWADKFK